MGSTGGNPKNGFDTTLEFVNVDMEYCFAFEDATKRWSSVILGDLENFTVSKEMANASECKALQEGEMIDDVYLCATIETIDREGNVLGDTDPTFIRLIGDRYFPSIGYMK